MRLGREDFSCSLVLRNHDTLSIQTQFKPLEDIGKDSVPHEAIAWSFLLIGAQYFCQKACHEPNKGQPCYNGANNMKTVCVYLDNNDLLP